MVNALTIFNVIFTYLFTVELVLKVTAYGMKGYFEDGFNVFDSLVVALSWIEVLM